MTYKVQIDDLIRDATKDEAARIDAVREEVEATAAAADAKAAAINSVSTKLKALGLSDSEIEALLGVSRG